MYAQYYNGKDRLSISIFALIGILFGWPLFGHIHAIINWVDPEMV
jgi:hypothetical protein